MHNLTYVHMSSAFCQWKKEARMFSAKFKGPGMLITALITNHALLTKITHIFFKQKRMNTDRPQGV